MTSKPLRSTARMACARPNPLPSQMFGFPMEIQGGCGGRRRDGGSAVCRQSAPWKIGLEKVIVILVSTGKKVREKKKNPHIGYCIIYGHSFLE